MDSLVLRITSPSRLTVVGAVCCAGWLLAFAVHHASADRLVDRDSNVIGRDFLAFYAAGHMIRGGSGSSLYDQQAQKRAQGEVIAPEIQEGFYYYINPAPVAVVYALLTFLPYLGAFYLHTAVMFGFFLIGMWAVRPHVSALASSWVAAVLVGVSWFPMMHAITAGQNTSLTFMLLAVAFAATVRGRQWLAGLALGVLFFKPQYALPGLGLLFLKRQWTTTAVALSVAALQYLVAVPFCGWDWPMAMLEHATGYFREIGRVVQGPTHISLYEVVDYSVMRPLEQAGARPGVLAVVQALVYLLHGLLIVFMIWLWRGADVRRRDFGLCWALAVAGSLLISMHAHYYDLALLILPILLILDDIARRGGTPGVPSRVAFIAVYLGYPFVFLFSISEIIGVQPVSAVSVWIFCWAALRVRQSRRAPVVVRAGA